MINIKLFVKKNIHFDLNLVFKKNIYTLPNLYINNYF